MSHPDPTFDPTDCDHQCSSNCRRVGCNCACGEWHNSSEIKLEVKCECEPNLTDDDSDKDAPDSSNNYPPNMDNTLLQ